MTIPRLLVALVAAVPCAVLLLPAFVIALAFHLFAWCAHAIGRVLEPRFVSWTDLIGFDPTLGWRPKRNLNTHYLAAYDDVHRIVTDAEGWPGVHSLDRSEIVVVGDSFAFGYGVDTHKCFAEVGIGSLIKAVGAPGYSMVHGVLLMDELRARLRGKLVVWFIYMENDLQDNLLPEMRMYRAPFLRRVRADGGWEIVRDHLRADRWQCSDLDKRRLFAHMCVPGAIADRAFSACDDLLHRGAQICRGAGARLVVLTIPHRMQLTPAGRQLLAAQSDSPEASDADLPDRRIADCCHRYGIPMVVGKDHLSDADYKHREGVHWNARGHRRVAHVLDEVRSSFTAGTLNDRIPHQRLEARFL